MIASSSLSVREVGSVALDPGGGGGGGGAPIGGSGRDYVDGLNEYRPRIDELKSAMTLMKTTWRDCL